MSNEGASVVRHKRSDQHDYAWIVVVAMVVCVILTTGIFQRLLEEHPAIAAFVLVSLVGAAWFARARSLKLHENQRIL